MNHIYSYMFHVFFLHFDCVRHSHLIGQTTLSGVIDKKNIIELIDLSLTVKMKLLEELLLQNLR